MVSSECCDLCAKGDDEEAVQERERNQRLEDNYRFKWNKKDNDRLWYVGLWLFIWINSSNEFKSPDLTVCHFHCCLKISQFYLCIACLYVNSWLLENMYIMNWWCT